MNAQDLYDEWTEGEQNGMRPARVQALREEFEEAMGSAVPRRIHEIEAWLEGMNQSGTITKKLRAAAEGDDEETEDEEDSSEGSTTEDSSSDDAEAE